MSRNKMKFGLQEQFIFARLLILDRQEKSGSRRSPHTASLFCNHTHYTRATYILGNVKKASLWHAKYDSKKKYSQNCPFGVQIDQSIG